MRGISVAVVLVSITLVTAGAARAQDITIPAGTTTAVTLPDSNIVAVCTPPGEFQPNATVFTVSPPGVTLGPAGPGMPAAGDQLLVTVPADHSPYQAIIISWSGNSACVSWNGGMTIRVSAPGPAPPSPTPTASPPSALPSCPTALASARAAVSICPQPPSCDATAASDPAAAELRRLRHVVALKAAIARARAEAASHFKQMQRLARDIQWINSVFSLPLELVEKTLEAASQGAEAMREWAASIGNAKRPGVLVRKPLFKKASTWRAVKKHADKLSRFAKHGSAGGGLAEWLLFNGFAGEAQLHDAALARAALHAEALERIDAMSAAEYEAFERRLCAASNRPAPTTAVGGWLVLDGEGQVVTGLDARLSGWERAASMTRPGPVAQAGRRLSHAPDPAPAASISSRISRMSELVLNMHLRSAAITAANRCVTSLHALDVRSQGFRYKARECSAISGGAADLALQTPALRRKAARALPSIRLKLYRELKKRSRAGRARRRAVRVLRTVGADKAARRMYVKVSQRASIKRRASLRATLTGKAIRGADAHLSALLREQARQLADMG